MISNQCRSTARILVVGLSVGAATAAAVAHAGPASAEPAPGTYTATVTQATPPDIVNIGGVMNTALTPCGPGCVGFLSSSETAWFGDLHLAGDSYTGPLQNGRTGVGGCNGTLDANAQTFIINCPADGETVTYSLTKTG